MTRAVPEKPPWMPMEWHVYFESLKQAPDPDAVSKLDGISASSTNAEIGQAIADFRTAMKGS